jgi:hypothetical protein
MEAADPPERRYLRAASSEWHAAIITAGTNEFGF